MREAEGAVVPALESRAAATAPAATTRHRWMLPMLLAGQAMAAMDTSIANVAAPSLRADLGVSGALLQMAVAGYGLAYAVFLITGARLGDLYGYRRLFVIGVALFTGSSLTCGLAPTTALLIVSRFAQGVGAALLVPQVLSLIQRNFDGNDRARAIGYYSMILGLGSTAGQLLGGLLVTLDLHGLSWRPAFLINVPIGIALIAYARSVLPEGKADERRRLDITGVVALSAAMLAIVVPLTFGREVHWQTWTWMTLLLGVVGLVGFWLYEKSLTYGGGSPLLNLEAVLTSGIRPGLLVVAIGFIGYGGWLFATALYLQSGLGYSAMTSGLVFTAYAFGFGIANVHWSKLPAKSLRWIPVASLVVMVFANVLFGVTAIRAGWVAALMVPLLFLAGSSHGLTYGTTVHQMTLRIARVHAPALSGLVTTAVQLSIVIGIAALGTLFLATAQPAAAETASRAMSHVTFAIAAGALIAIACSLRLATVRTAAVPIPQGSAAPDAKR
ncbi:MAG: MFS transporter [Sulfurifustis sp.]